MTKPISACPKCVSEGCAAPGEMEVSPAGEVSCRFHGSLFTCTSGVPLGPSSIKVTPEMIEAGLYWLDLYDPDYSDHAEFLTKIFAAMEFALRRYGKRKPRKEAK